MYRCEICGAVMVDRPVRRASILQPDGFRERGYEESCPYCESPHIVPYDPYKEKEEVYGGRHI